MRELDAMDLYDVKSLLSEEELMVQSSVARFVASDVLPVIRECFERQRFPTELIPKLASLGLLGCTLEGYGCAGLGPVAYGLVAQELERGDSALQTFVSVQGVLSMSAIHAFGSSEQKSRWLPTMAKGESIGCFALSATAATGS
jgi:glutaryl-CoA dehydrogenase